MPQAGPPLRPPHLPPLCEARVRRGLTPVTGLPCSSAQDTVSTPDLVLDHTPLLSSVLSSGPVGTLEAQGQTPALSGPS